MTKQAQANRARLMSCLSALGFTFGEAHQLRRIEMTLSRWSEHECNGTIQRDGEDGDGAPRAYYEMRDGSHKRGPIVADRERGALKRLAAIVDARNAREPGDIVHGYHQGDPRGAALYIVRTADLAGGDIDSLYTRGLAICD